MSKFLNSQLQSELFELYGPLIGGEELIRAAGFRTANAFKLAVRRGRVGFDVFQITGRRGKFARTSDVTSWLNSIGREPRAQHLVADSDDSSLHPARKRFQQTQP